MCSYNLSDINSMMDGSYQTCVVEGSGNKNVRWVRNGQTSCTSLISESPTVVSLITYYLLNMSLFLFV